MYKYIKGCSDSVTASDSEFQMLKNQYNDCKTFNDMDADSGKIRDLLDDLQNKGVPYQEYKHKTDKGITIFYDTISSGTDVMSSKNDFNRISKELNDSLYDAVSSYMLNLGFELSEIADYSVVDINETDDGQIRVEVRTELDYEELIDLLDVLDLIIQKYDSDSYFEPVTSGIAEAYIDLDTKEELRSWLDDVADAVDKYEGIVVSNDGITIEIAFSNSRMLNKFVDALNIDKSNIVNSDVDHIVYVPVTKVESTTSVEATSEYDNREVVTRNNHKYAVRYTSVDTSPEANPMDMFDHFKFVISRISPYDDAEYAWCKGEQGTVKCYRNGELVNKTFYADADDLDVENDEWCDIIINESIKILEKMNHSIEPRIIHNSTSVTSDEVPESAKLPATNESYSHSDLRQANVDAIEYFIEFEDIYPFPKEKFLASNWEELQDGVAMGIDDDLEIAEGIMQYLQKEIDFNNRHKEIYEDDPQAELTLEIYNKVKKEYEKEISKYESVSSAVVNGASYGGAFDIEDDQYFTRDDLMEFGENVCDNLNEIFYDTFDLYNIYMKDSKTLHIEVERKSDEMVAEYEFRIDMRKIRRPKDLISKYAGDAVYDFRQQFEEYPVESATDISAGLSDTTEPPLDPPEYDEPDIRTIDQIVYVTWRDLQITVDTSGFWSYSSEDWAYPDTSHKDRRWRTDEENLGFADGSDIIEAVDEIIEPYIPRDSGTYNVSADIQLHYTITAEAEITLYEDGSRDEDFYEDSVEAEFNPVESTVENFTATKQ